MLALRQKCHPDEGDATDDSVVGSSMLATARVSMIKLFAANRRSLKTTSKLSWNI